MACTSIVAQDPTGNIFHGRNLDWDIPDNIRNLTVQVAALIGNTTTTGICQHMHYIHTTLDPVC